jgi:hypothetical protein
MIPQHKSLAAGRWQTLTFIEQMANVGSEIERTVTWKNKGNNEFRGLAFKRALELLDLTINDEKNRHRLREIVRVRELLADHFYFDNSYNSTDRSWQKYFYFFNFAAQLNRDRNKCPGESR